MRDKLSTFAQEESKDEVPAELVNLYVERDGAWMLDVDGAVEKSKLDEFRSTNVALLKERDELKQRFEGIDPDEVRKLADEKRRLEEERQLKAGEVEKVVENRINSKAPKKWVRLLKPSNSVRVVRTASSETSLSV